MISIICAVNDELLFKTMLLASLKRQTYQHYEIIKLNSVELGFKSAAKTLNYGANVAKGDILVFIHQDIEFIKDDGLEKLNDYATSLEFGIAGVAGIITGDRVYSSVTMDYNHRHAGLKNADVKEVDSLDECMLIVKKKNFKGFYDYDSWHFYGVEYSLRCIREKEKVIIRPIDIYHLSPGWSLNKSYWKTLKMVAKNFRDFKIIPTTMGQFKNNHLLVFKVMYRRLKILVKKFLNYKKTQ